MQDFNFGQWTRVSGTAAGTTTISDRDGYIVAVNIPVTKAGTVHFYDNASGTAAADEIFIITNQPNAATFPVAFKPGVRFKKGLTVVKTGTTDMTITWF